MRSRAGERERGLDGQREGREEPRKGRRIVKRRIVQPNEDGRYGKVKKIEAGYREFRDRKVKGPNESKWQVEVAGYGCNKFALGYEEHAVHH